MPCGDKDVSTKSFGIIKLALRSYSDGENIHALMELKSLIKAERDCWTAYLVKGKVNAALHRYYEAIADYSLVLEMSQNLNERNRRYVLQSIALCATRLTALQKTDLDRYFRRGPAMPKRGQDMPRGKVPKKTLADLVPGPLLPVPVKKPETGRIAHIGKFLIDRRDAETIERFIANGAAGLAGMQILSLEAVAKLQAALKKVDKHVGVVGSCIIGRDGLLRVSSMPADYDAESLGTCALAVYLTAANTSGTMARGKIEQIIVRSQKGYMVIVEMGEQILICMTEAMEPAQLAKLVKKIVTVIG